MNFLHILVHKYFLKRIVQILFVPLLFLVLALPQLTAEIPSPFFAALKNLLSQYGWLILPVILVVGIFIIWQTITFDFSRWLQQQGDSMRFNTRQLINKANGGNGLATGPLKYNWFLGWMTHIYVKPNEDCAVVDGKQVIRKPQKLYKSASQQVEIKHVLLYPEPRKDIKLEQARSNDNWPVTLTISVDYEVADPVRIAGLGDPISKLDELIQGALIDYVGQHRAESFTGNQAHLKKIILDALKKSEALKIFNIKEILKAKADVDERAIKDKRDDTLALENEDLKQKLTVAQAERKRLEAQIEAETEQIKALPPFQREMVLLKTKLGMETYLRLTQVIESATKANETSPERVLEVIKQLGGGLPSSVINDDNVPYHRSTPELIEARVTQLSRRELEEEEFERLKPLLGIQDFRVYGRGNRVEGAEVKLSEYTIKLICDPTSYPKNAPNVNVIWNNQSRQLKSFDWQADWFLAQVVTHIALKAKAKQQR